MQSQGVTVASETTEKESAPDSSDSSESDDSPNSEKTLDEIIEAYSKSADAN